MLVCKNLNDGSVFSTLELSRYIGKYLFDELLDEVPLTGAAEE